MMNRYCWNRALIEPFWAMSRRGIRWDRAAASALRASLITPLWEKQARVDTLAGVALPASTHKLTQQRRTGGKPPPNTMTFRDLQSAIARLESDPRIHQNTRVLVEFAQEIPIGDEANSASTYEITSEPLVSIAIAHGALVLAATAAEPAVAR